MHVYSLQRMRRLEWVDICRLHSKHSICAAFGEHSIRYVIIINSIPFHFLEINESKIFYAIDQLLGLLVDVT